LIQQPNQGVSVARNRGVAEAKGELIAFLDPDDAWKPGYLEKILHLRREFPQAGIYATAYEIVDPQGSLMPQKFNVLPPESDQGLIRRYFKLALSRPEPLTTSAVTVPKKILQEINGFLKGEYLGEDVDAWLKIALFYPIAWSGEKLVFYHRDVVNPAVDTRLWNREPAISRTVRQALASGLVPPNQQNDLREYAAYFQVNAALHLLRQGDKKTARQMLDYAQGTQALAGKWWVGRIMCALPGNHFGSLLGVYRKFKKIGARIGARAQSGITLAS
jgi:glycosyltransferase involved in cell wall biosynthesis